MPMSEADMAGEIVRLRDELSAAIGHMVNAHVELGCSTKAAAARVLDAGIKRGLAAVEKNR